LIRAILPSALATTIYVHRTTEIATSHTLAWQPLSNIMCDSKHSEHLLSYYLYKVIIKFKA